MSTDAGNAQRFHRGAFVFARVVLVLSAAALDARAEPPGRGGAAKSRKPAAKSPAAIPYSEHDLLRQVALDRAGFSPGLIDGKPGRKTAAALRAFQQARGLPVTGQFDTATDATLGVSGLQPFASYTISDDDARQIGVVPKDWNAKAALKRLKFASLAELVGERGHCSGATLSRLNPGIDLGKLAAGAQLTIPNVLDRPALPRVSTLEVNLDEKMVTARDAGGRVVALFHCSVAKDPAKFPRGRTKLASVAIEPVYMFDPRMWPEVRNVTRKLTIPPGPRNPVGLAWLGTHLPGYGIHGTPNPEMIGKTGSHGCIRLTNWDVLRLAAAVQVGTPVRFVREGEVG